eukprot:Skav233293  [mRNA]  locus=scaffold1501:36180:43117:+ [translate_table: standard]
MTRWWTLSFALICPLHLTVRTAIESDDEPEEANVSGTCAVICRRVVPWVDRDDPINGSTMEIFVDPAVALKKLRRPVGCGSKVLPCLAFTLLVAVSAAAMHVLIYSCSSGELEALYMAGVDDAMTFKASQDRYVVMLDSSFQQIILEAVGTEYLAREIIFHPGKKTNSSARSGDSANALIELHSMKIPRTVDVAVSGLRRSLNSTNYSIRFAPKQLLPQKLLIVSEDHSFQRCIPFSTLPGSRLSIPTDVSKVQVGQKFGWFLIADI